MSLVLGSTDMPVLFDIRASKKKKVPYSFNIKGRLSIVKVTAAYTRYSM